MVTRVTKPATVPTKQAKAAAKAVQPDVASPKTAFEEMQDAVRAAQERYFDEVGAPSWQRSIASWLLSIIAGAAVYYWGITLANMLVLAVAALTGYGFITFVLAVLSVIAVGTAAVGVGVYTFRAVGSVNVGAVKSRVTGWFKRGDAKPATA